MDPRLIILSAVDLVPSRWLMALSGRDHQLVREAICSELIGDREIKTCVVRLSTGNVGIVFAEVDGVVPTVLIERIDLSANPRI
jgi:hypothetical protein